MTSWQKTTVKKLESLIKRVGKKRLEKRWQEDFALLHFRNIYRLDKKLVGFSIYRIRQYTKIGTIFDYFATFKYVKREATDHSDGNDFSFTISFTLNNCCLP